MLYQHELIDLLKKLSMNLLAKIKLSFIVFTSVAITVISCSPSATNVNKKEDSAKRPNVLILLADQWSGESLGLLGKEKVQTPHLDSFAKESLVLTQMVTLVNGIWMLRTNLIFLPQII